MNATLAPATEKRRTPPDSIRVFVGGGPEHWLPTMVLIHSIRLHTTCNVSTFRLLDVEDFVPIPPKWRNKCPTSFSLQRFLIPEACRFKGHAIYLDSDMVVRADIADLWNTPFPPKANVLTTGGWQSAVMLIDCATARWRIDDLCRLMDSGKLAYNKLSNLRGAFASVAGELDPLWNVMDRPELTRIDRKDAKLIHYTSMNHQPWLRAGHPCDHFWLDALAAAMSDGDITHDDVLREIDNGHVRPSLAAVIGREPPCDDREFVFPDTRRKMKVRAAA